MTTALLSKLDDLVAGLPTKLLIGGRDADSAHRATFGVRNPATGETFINVADATETDAVAALDAAAAAQQSWSAPPPLPGSDL